MFAALGSGGDLVFNFDTSTGTLIQQSESDGVESQPATTALRSIALRRISILRAAGPAAECACLRSVAAGALNEIAVSPFASGGQAYSVVLDNTGKYAYAANRTNGTIYGYSIGTGAVLTALGGSPYTSGKLVTSLGMDSSGKYLLAAAFGGSPDLSMYSFDTTTPGKLILGDQHGDRHGSRRGDCRCVDALEAVTHLVRARECRANRRTTARDFSASASSMDIEVSEVFWSFRAIFSSFCQPVSETKCNLACCLCGDVGVPAGWYRRLLAVSAEAASRVCLRDGEADLSARPRGGGVEPDCDGGERRQAAGARPRTALSEGADR